jgi:hypothetical protein
VKLELDADMSTFGYEIVNVLVTDIVPDQKVKSAMNDINAAQREQVAANARGEAEKILVVKKAEAEAESKALQGQGIANQRKAIIEGLQVSVEQFQKAVEGATSKEVMQLVLVTQYFDTLKSIGESDKTNTLFLSHSPAAVNEVSDQILKSMLVANNPGFEVGTLGIFAGASGCARQSPAARCFHTSLLSAAVEDCVVFDDRQAGAEPLYMRHRNVFPRSAYLLFSPDGNIH